MNVSYFPVLPFSTLLFFFFFFFYIENGFSPSDLFTFCTLTYYSSMYIFHFVFSALLAHSAAPSSHRNTKQYLGAIIFSSKPSKLPKIQSYSHHQHTPCKHIFRYYFLLLFSLQKLSPSNYSSANFSSLLIQLSSWGFNF